MNVCTYRLLLPLINSPCIIFYSPYSTHVRKAAHDDMHEPRRMSCEPRTDHVIQQRVWTRTAYRLRAPPQPHILFLQSVAYSMLRIVSRSFNSAWAVRVQKLPIVSVLVRCTCLRPAWLVLQVQIKCMPHPASPLSCALPTPGQTRSTATAAYTAVYMRLGHLSF